MRVKLALGQIGLSQVGPGQLGPVILAWSYIAYYFHFKNASTILFMCFIKNVQQKFEGIMFGRIYILGLSILTILPTQRVQLHNGM